MTTNKKKNKYEIPKEAEITYNVERYFNCPPNSKDWIHDIQKDDTLDENALKRTKIINELKNIPVATQRSKEWFSQRERLITASDCGCAIGVNHYEPRYKLVVKKITNIPFAGNAACYNGKKYEMITSMVYEYRMNVQTHEYGCIEHPNKKYHLGASPDRIVDIHKFDGIHKTRYVGRMIEIKDPTSREINVESNNVFDVCPMYYYAQIQVQLECCNLDECDFWQNKIVEYANRNEFIEDTMSSEPFRSKKTGYEKGCVIQLLPIDVDFNDIKTFVFDCAKFIYPPKIEMSPHDCDVWIADTLSNYKENPEYKNYVIDKVIYWKVEVARCILIKRDKKWFADAIPKIQKIWNYIEFFRNPANVTEKELLLKYINFAENKYSKKTLDNKIMSTMEIIYDTSSSTYEDDIKTIEQEISIKKSEDDFDEYEIVV